MTHTEISFENLQQALSRCGEKLASEAIAEIRTAINQAVAQAASAAEVDTLLHPVQTNVEAAQAARRGKAAARRAAKKAAQAEQTAQAAQPDTTPVPSGEGRGEAADATFFTLEMVKYLRRCPDQHMLAVLNSYLRLIFTGHLVHSDDDHRYLDNFIYLTRTLGLIDNPEPPTAEQAAAYLFDNPALPLPRADRRALERLRRKQSRKQFGRHSEKV